MTLDIVIPFWGRLDYLQQVVHSVLDQSDPDWRLVVIDDAYPDETPGAWVQSIQDPRVTYVRNQTNLGVSGNFAKALQVARSPYVAMPGADDVLGPDYVKVMRRLAELYPAAAMLHPKVTVIDAQGSQVLPLADRIKSLLRPREDLVAGESLARSLARGNWAYFPAMTWRVEALRAVGFAPQHQVVQDLRAMLDLVLADGSMALADEAVFVYRRHGSSVSSELRIDGARFAEERELLDEAAARFAKRGWRSAARAARCRVTSRLNAVATLPHALLRRDGAGLWALLRHACGR